MRKNTAYIPINTFADESEAGVSIEKFSFESLPVLAEWEQPERHDRHSFFLLESGNVDLEIDFERYTIDAPAVIYMHPDQVHRIIGFNGVTVCAWAITDENLKPEYLQLLENILPAKPISLHRETFVLMTEAALLCIKLSERKNKHLHHSLLSDHCNALIGLVISLYLEKSAAATVSRAELVTKVFRAELARYFTELKRPSEFAEKLHLSIPYLNECIKNATGQSVTWHIQQRVILEAKRLLCHTDQSLKEIAAALGYDDYAYFSRLFTRVAGLSPVQFRNKNLD